MSKKELYEGPDISYHQGNVNIKAIREAGYNRIGIRAGYGKNNVDQKYVANADACHNLNVPVMLYWFSYAYTVEMAIAEAKYAIAQAKKYWKKCPIAFDFEYDSVNYARKNGVEITKNLCTDMAIAFLKKVRESGYVPVIYMNRDYSRNYFDMQRIVAEVGTVYLWYARYASTIPDSELNAADVWQYTSSGRIPGVSGNVDLNHFYTDFSDMPAETEVKCNINIQNFQKAANADGYRDARGNKLVADGKDGTNTQYVRKQIVLRVKRVKLLWVERSTGELVKWLQMRLNEIMCAGITVTGEYDDATVKAVKEFQKKYNLVADGIAGYNTIQMMFYN